MSTRINRFVLQAGFDGVAWLVGLWFATWFRYDMDGGAISAEALHVVIVAATAVALQVLIGSFAGLYVRRWRYGSLEEVSALVPVVVLSTIIVTLLNLAPLLTPQYLIPTSACIVGGALALSMMCAGRLGWRWWIDRCLRFGGGDREPVIVLGAGEAGLQLITTMQRSGPFDPVALLDDDPHLRNMRVRGLPVLGDRSALESVARRTGAATVVIAIPSASSTLIREVSAIAYHLGMRTMILPPVSELLGGKAEVGDVRAVTEEDLLGRRELDLDIDAVASYVTGKAVLVTGAGGSIGSELCRQLHRFAPSSLIMLDRDESALQAVQLSIEGRGLLDSRDLVVACIRDRERMAAVFAEHRPQVVFHAAALKHLPMLEMHPDEGWKTNVVGTQNMLELSHEFGVERFVNISTDKAADPSSVLGHTKRTAERLTAHAAGSYSGDYVSVRFGNVIGSRGSVLPLFREQIARGGPITVTHPEVTRFFMTIPEACQLVIQAGALDSMSGHVLVLDMGESMRIADLARRLVHESGKRIEIVYTGLRPGEKMHEQLFGDDESPTPSSHPYISSVDVPPLDPADLGGRTSPPVREHQPAADWKSAPPSRPADRQVSRATSS